MVKNTELKNAQIVDTPFLIIKESHRVSEVPRKQLLQRCPKTYIKISALTEKFCTDVNTKILICKNALKR